MANAGDYATPIEEVMQSLNQLVLSGKVLYLGISDTPAWVVSRANQYARDHGLAPFVYVFQLSLGYFSYLSAAYTKEDGALILATLSETSSLCARRKEWDWHPGVYLGAEYSELMRSSQK